MLLYRVVYQLTDIAGAERRKGLVVPSVGGIFT